MTSPETQQRSRPAKQQPPRRRLSRFLWGALIIVAIVMLLPYLLVPLYRVVDPVSTLMLWRWSHGARVERSFVPIGRMAPALPTTVIAAEDGRYCRHHGIDWQELHERLEDVDDISEARGVSTIPSRPPRTCSCGRAGACCARRWSSPSHGGSILSCRNGACSKSISISRSGGPMASSVRKPRADMRSTSRCIRSRHARRRCWQQCCPIPAVAAQGSPARRCGGSPASIRRAASRRRRLRRAPGICARERSCKGPLIFPGQWYGAVSPPPL